MVYKDSSLCHRMISVSFWVFLIKLHVVLLSVYSVFFGLGYFKSFEAGNSKDVDNNVLKNEFCELYILREEG